MTQPLSTRRIGSLPVSVIGLGCNNFGWRLGERESIEVVHAALDRGITFFDTADKYGETKSELFLGKALRGRRGDVVIATKFGGRIAEGKEGASPRYVREAAEASLKRLGVDTIDLYQLHTPDPATPIADTLAALDELVKEGKVREIGCSNFSVEQLREAEAAVRDGAARFVSVQNELSLMKPEAEAAMLPECERLGIAFLPYFPLAAGLLTGKVRKDRPPPSGSRLAEEERYAPLVTDESLQRVEELAQWAEAKGHSLLELAFAWLLAHDAVASVIAGATSPHQVEMNAASGGWRLTHRDRDEITARIPRFPMRRAWPS